MGSILRNLLWTAAISRGTGEMKRALQRVCRRAALIAAGLALALVAGGFLVAAGLMVLTDLVGAVRACLIVGAAFAVFGGAFLFYGARRRRRNAGAAPLDYATSGPHSIAADLVDVGRQLGDAASRNPGSFVAAAFVVGLVLGRMRR
jgi:hypothetical protein